MTGRLNIPQIERVGPILNEVAAASINRSLQRLHEFARSVAALLDPASNAAQVEELPVVFHAIPSTGSTSLRRGDPVRIVGGVADGRPIVQRADSAANATMGAVGLAATPASTTFDAPIQVVHLGMLRGFDTSAWSVGTKLYVASGGGLTSTAPASIVQHVATVVRQDAREGELYVVGPNADGGIISGPPALLFSGTDAPEGSVTSDPGGVYIQNHPSDPAVWLKRDGTGNTGWLSMLVPGVRTIDHGAAFVVSTERSGVLYRVNANAGDVVASLSGTPTVGFLFWILKEDAGPDIATFEPGGSHLINGQAQAGTSTQYGVVWYLYVETNVWRVWAAYGAVDFSAPTPPVPESVQVFTARGYYEPDFLEYVTLE